MISIEKQHLFKWKHYQPEIILLTVRWYLRYNLSFCNLVEMMEERSLQMAASDILGFGSPKICVQVTDTSNLSIGLPWIQLIGTMSNFNADYGLLVSWNGFDTCN